MNPASVHHPWTRAFWCWLRFTVFGAFLPCLSLILLLSYMNCNSESKSYDFSQHCFCFWGCLCIDLFCCLHCLSFPEGTSHFLMHMVVVFCLFGCFYFACFQRFFSHSAMELRMFLTKLSLLILDISEEVDKNIFFCMTEHCYTKTILYFKHTEFNCPDEKYI